MLHHAMKSYLAVFLVLTLSPAFCGHAFADDEDLPYVEIKKAKDLSSLAEQARESKKIIMLEVSSSDCSYCRLLEEEIIKPMIRSGDYKDSVLIRQLETDSFYTIKDFTGDETTSAGLAQSYKVKLTPTLLFLDADGKEVSERIRGVYSLDFFGGYVDDALAKGLKIIRQD
jgi:thioredoxin-related protein